MRISSILCRMSSSQPSCVSKNLAEVVRQVTRAYESADVATRAAVPPRLVAVSKTKPKELVIEAYNAGQRHFGENYVQELVDKSSDPEIREKCPDISWHFIGTCQTNKAGKVAQSHNLSVVETVTTAKLADKLQSFCAAVSDKIIDVMVQVNTSGEESKNGVEPVDALALARHIVDKCPSLRFVGLMTIGALGHSLATEHAEGANPDFLSLIDCRRRIAEELKVAEMSLELSMGMSNDFEEAVRMGSTNVRIGSSIFGDRNYAAEAADVKGIEGALNATTIKS